MSRESIRCPACRRKLCEIREFRAGELALKCPRCGAYHTVRAIESPSPRAPERPRSKDARCPTPAAALPSPGPNTVR